MSINPDAARPAQTDPPTHTQATDYYAARLQQQTQANVPRSAASWGAEQSRLGSWASGQGALRPSGNGPSYSNGIGRPNFMYDPEDS